MVQRPSPESETRPENRSRVGCSKSEMAVRSSKPRGDDATAAPDFCNVREIEIILVVFGIAERRGLGIRLAMGFSGVGVLKNVEPFRVGGHQAVFDAVVHHLHEMSGPGRAAVEIALFSSSANFFASRSAIGVSAAGGQRFEDRIKEFDNVRFAANHLAVATLEAPDTAARAHVAIMNLLGRKLFGATDVVDVVGVSAVDHDVARFQLAGKIVERRIDDRCGHHQPNRARLLQFLDEIVERSRARRAFPREQLHRVRAAVVHDALVPAFCRRRTMLAPILPSPIMPSCIAIAPVI